MTDIERLARSGGITAATRAYRARQRNVGLLCVLAHIAGWALGGGLMWVAFLVRPMG